MSGLFTPFLFQTAVQAITPILLAALAGVLCGRVGVFNIALEGQMLVGAFAAIAGSYFAHSALAGVAAALAGATVFSLVLAYGATVFRGDPIVIGIGMNLLASGLTAYLLRVIFGVSGTFSDPGIVGLGRVAITPLVGVPVVGWAFARQSALTWAAWALTALVSVVLFKTPVGLRLRGVGEEPGAAETLGVDVARARIATVLVSGALAGLAGAQLSLGVVSVFAEDMTAGPADGAVSGREGEAILPASMHAKQFALLASVGSRSESAGRMRARAKGYWRRARSGDHPWLTTKSVRSAHPGCPAAHSFRA